VNQGTVRLWAQIQTSDGIKVRPKKAIIRPLPRRHNLEG